MTLRYSNVVVTVSSDSFDPDLVSPSPAPSNLNQPAPAPPRGGASTR